VSDNAPIYSKKMVGKHFPATTIIKERTMKMPSLPAKTTIKNKQQSSASKKWLPPMKGSSLKGAKTTAMPVKKC